jgi:Ca2+-binding RTX toxin-like protein
VSSSGGVIRHEPGAGERSILVVSPGSGNELAFTDVGPADIRAGAGCTFVRGDDSEPYVTCPSAGVGAVTIDLGDGNDTASLLFSGTAAQPAPIAVSGGSGTDGVITSGAVTLDGVADDGPKGLDNIGADVENVTNAYEGIDDRFAGSAAANRLESPGGTDVMSGAGGDDYINTRDVLFNREESGALPPDQVTCGSGNDIADVDDRDVVAADCEIVIRKSGEVRLTDGADVFRAPRPGLTIFGLAGNDVIDAGGARVVSGGDGNDRITLGAALDITANGNDGDDRIYGLAARDRIIGGDGNDKLYGERSNDRIDGGAGRDGIDAGRGDDLVRVRDGEADRVHCSTGRDKVIADRKDKVERDCEKVYRR